MADAPILIGRALEPDWSAEPDLDKLRHCKALLQTDRLLALRGLEELADSGSIMSMLYLAHEHGHGALSSRNLEASINWYERAINAGSVLASFHLGLLYKGVGRFAEAFDAFKVGAEADLAASIYQLGRMYRDGLGVSKNLQEAQELWDRASVLGHPYAKRNVACFLISGRRGILNVPRGFLLLFAAIFQTFRLSMYEPTSYLLK